MNAQISLEELKRIATTFKGRELPMPLTPEFILSLVDEIERLRTIHNDYGRGLEITAQILTTLGRDPLPTLAGRLNQIVVLAAFKHNPT